MFMQKPVSIIVPVYQVKDYLRQCVDSILNQTFKDYELILVDDGSTDGSGKICDEYSMKDPRIIVIHKTNGGLSDARNAGIEIAKGKYFSFIDSDDIVTDDFIESLYNCIEENKCKLAISNITAFYEDGTENEAFYKPVDSPKVVVGDERYKSVIRPSACNKMYARDLFDEIKYPKGKLYEDLYIYHYLLEKSERIVYTGKNSYYYRIRTSSIMTAKYTLASTDIIFGYYDRAKFFQNKHCMDLANDAYLWVYSRTAIAYSHLDKNCKENKKKIKEINTVYKASAHHIIFCKGFQLKQRLAALLLLVSPKIHEMIFPSKDKVN